MSPKHILIPLAQDSRDLKALHHAISLAERIEAKLSVVSFEPKTMIGHARSPVVLACLDVIHQASGNGMNIAFFLVPESPEKAEAELLRLLERETIDLIIVSDAEKQLDVMFHRLLPRLHCQVVQVKKKHDINYLY